MDDVLKVDVVTLFPGMLSGFLEESMMKRAAQAGLVEFNIINPRDFTTDKHNTTDDRPFGGGPGMVMKCEPLFATVESVQTPQSRVLLMTPAGTPFKQAAARRLADDCNHLIIICGHYEGVDQRVVDARAEAASFGPGRPGEGVVDLAGATVDGGVLHVELCEDPAR